MFNNQRLFLGRFGFACFPTCQVRVVRFYQSCSPPPHLLLVLLLAVQIPVGTAGPPPRAPDPSGHCRTSTASCRSQWALPGLNQDFQVAVGTAGPQPRAPIPVALPDPQPRAPDPSGHCRTSTATSRSQWALPDSTGRMSEKMSE